jgi:hypothetical protein
VPQAAANPHLTAGEANARAWCAAVSAFSFALFLPW